MSHLDDKEFLHRHDPMEMSVLTNGFLIQCHEARSFARAVALPETLKGKKQIVVTGLGGSAAGGDLLSALLVDQGSVPGSVNREYTMPSFVDCDTLVFATSYSGNTEETLSAYRDAKARGAAIVVVSSGGKLSEWAVADGYPVISVPGGQPPRTALGYMFLPLVVSCEKLGYLPNQDFDDVFSAIESVALTCGFEQPEAANPAKKLAQAMSGKLATIYGAGGWQYALAQRWRGQINENSKEMVITHFFPELCHNEILGWEGSHEQGVDELVSVVLWGGDESQRIRDRIAITKRLIGDATSFLDVTAMGSTRLAQMLSLAHFGDWVSLYLAALAGRDPGRMMAIDQLKEELSRLD
jgi:glucose/mannose-6-phosphate isomerase